MPVLYSKCGIDCGHCPWSRYVRGTIKTEEDYERFGDRCKEILGVRPTEYYRNCVGCQTPDEEVPKGWVPFRNCAVRICAMRSSVENCAYCSRFPCTQVKELGTGWTREELEAKREGPIPEEDYLAFIEPFEGLKHLEAVRASLDPDDIAEPATVPPLKMRIVDFPEDLLFSEAETQAFKALHELLKILLSTNADTYATQAAFKKRRRFTYNVLWLFGRLGELTEDDGAYLVVKGEMFMREKKRRNLTRWKQHSEILKDYGVHVGRVPLNEKEWVLRLSFDPEVGGVAELKALQRYTAILDEKYGKKALQHFSKADMQVLT